MIEWFSILMGQSIDAILEYIDQLQHRLDLDDVALRKVTQLNHTGCLS